MAWINEANTERTAGVRIVAFFLALSLLIMPQALNSRSLVLLMDDYGAMPSPIAEEEEVKHSCSISWNTVSHANDEHLLHRRCYPMIDDPYDMVDHGEVDVPPPKG